MNKFGKLSVISASLILPIALLISGIVAFSFKSSNPDNVDITAGLAYLRQILGSSFITFGVIWAISLVSALLGFKKDASKELSKLGILILLLVTVLSIGAGIANKATSDAEDAYQEEKTRQFFQQFE